MKVKRTICYVAVCLSFPNVLNAAVATISGGVSTGYEYFDRKYDNSSSYSEDDNYSRFRVSPFVTIASETARQSLEFKYAPSYWYDADQSEDDLDHQLSLEYLRMLTQYWNVSLTDRLSINDEFNSYSPITDPETGDIISQAPGVETSGDALRDERGRRRYTNNSLKLGTAYTYYEDSSVALDYVWTTLRNDQGYSGSNYQDYDKHDVGLTVGHRFDSRWKAIAEAGFIQGLYESVEDDSSAAIPADSDDVEEYRASLLIDYRLSQVHSLNGYYGYEQSDYESVLRNDAEIHNITLGWAWDISKRLSVNIGAGPTYTKQDGSSGDWSANADFGMKYTLEKGKVGLKASHGTTVQNFSGTDERGNTEFWRLQSYMNYSLTEYLSTSVYASYSNEDRDETTALSTPNTETITTKVYAIGCSFNYRFLENYTAGLSYGYVHNTSDNDEDNYDDHRIALTVSYENDFFQW